FFFFQAEDGIRDPLVTGVQTCALPIFDAYGTCGIGGAGDWLRSKQSAMSSALASRWRNVERPKFTSQNFNRLTCEWKMNRSPGHVPPDTAGSDRRPSNLIPLSRLRNHGVENLLIPRGSWSRRS